MAKAFRVYSGPNDETRTSKLDNLQAPINTDGMRPAEHGSNRRDWMQLAWTLDRLFLLTYLAINVVATLVIFVQYTQ